MNFYDEWSACKGNPQKNVAAIHAFLCSSDESLTPLYVGESTDLQAAFDVIGAVPIESFFDVLQGMEIPRSLIPADVPCFSNFENGAARLSELLEFEPDGLSFSDAGYQLMNSVKDGARTKYGENHSKLAAMMSLVSISNTRPAIITATRWGSFLTKYEMRQKADVLQKMLLRDLCVKTIVKNALNGQTSYREAVAALSKSTALRRRTNVKCLVEFVLNGTEREEALSRIDWEL